mmetsp:Transcript_16827/g.27665  ORF Transcript_16827/g.27665 Transcript_16827/m.27665 type:complete len:260 (+) Transcript_16827:373-1152(+)
MLRSPSPMMDLPHRPRRRRRRKRARHNLRVIPTRKKRKEKLLPRTRAGAVERPLLLLLPLLHLHHQQRLKPFLLVGRRKQQTPSPPQRPSHPPLLPSPRPLVTRPSPVLVPLVPSELHLRLDLLDHSDQAPLDQVVPLGQEALVPEALGRSARLGHLLRHLHHLSLHLHPHPLHSLLCLHLPRRLSVRPLRSGARPSRPSRSSGERRLMMPQTLLLPFRQTVSSSAALVSSPLPAASPPLSLLLPRNPFPTERKKRIAF